MPEQEESSGSQPAKAKPTAPISLPQNRAQPASLWTVNRVQQWFDRHCSEYKMYSQLFVQHEISGRALLRINENTLERMGIDNNEDRKAILREIIKEKLKTDIVDFRKLDSMHDQYDL